MADEADIANERMQLHIDESLRRALARPVPRKVTLACAHCEEFPRVAGSIHCERCAAELMQ